MNALWPRLSVLIAASLLMLCAAWLILMDVEVRRPEPLRLSDAPVQVFAATLPVIADYATYDVNDENPFIPVHERAQASRARMLSRNPVRPPVVRLTPPPPAPPVQVKVPPPPPPWAPPALGAQTDSRPEPIGVISRSDEQGEVAVILMRMPGTADLQPVRVGDVTAGWTIVSLSADSVVSLRDPAGVLHTVPIAANGNAAAPTATPTPTGGGPAPQPGPPPSPTPGGTDPAQQLASWLTPPQIDALLARQDRDLIFKQIASRLGGSMTPAQIEALLRNMQRRTHGAAPLTMPEFPAPPRPGTRPPPRP